MKLSTPVLLMITSSLGFACDRLDGRNDHRDTADNAEMPPSMAPPPAARGAEPVDRNMPADRNMLSDRDDDTLEDGAESKREAEELVEKASATLEKMKRDDGLKKLLSQSRGLMIVPEYGRAAAGLGVRGGEGILIAHSEGETWSNPAFYNIGGVSLGAQLGAEGGEIAILFMDDRALKASQGDNSFSLNAGADLTLVDYSRMAEAPLNKDAGNVVFWSDKKGAFAGVSLGITDIAWDDEENAAYYGKSVKPKEIFEGRTIAPQGKLQEQLTEI